MNWQVYEFWNNFSGSEWLFLLLVMAEITVVLFLFARKARKDREKSKNEHI